MRHSILLHGALAALLCAAGCSSHPEAASRAQALNWNPAIGDFAVYAKSSIALRAGASVGGGDLGVKDVASSTLFSGKEIAIGVNSQVTTTARNVLGNRVLLDENSVVGDVHTNTLTVLGGTHGTVAAMPSSMPALPSLQSVTAGSSNLTLAENAVVTLSASASKATVTLNDGSTLKLAAGLYQFGSLRMYANCRIEALGAVEIRITGRILTGINAYFGPASGVTLTAHDYRIEVTATNGGSNGPSSTPHSVHVDDGATIKALVLAPNGTVYFGQSDVITGAVVANHIDLRESSTVTYQDGFGAICSGGCDDANPCTTDACSSGSCTHTPVATGTACPNSTVCDGAEICNATGTCTAGNAPTVDDGNACTADSCDAVTGVHHTAVATGTACPNSTVCDGAETCNATGTCTAGTALTTDDANPCTADSCDAVTGVHHTAVAAGTSCADGNLCNGAEACNATGTCLAGTALATDDANICTTDSCDPVTGVHHTPVAAGSSCTDGNACNGVEACDFAGTCLAGTAPTVSDGNACTADSCDPTTGVHHDPVAAGTACLDSTVCNGSEACDATGHCQAGTALATDDANPCTADSCDPTTGVAHTPVAAGTSCSDGNVCNGSEACNATGSCQSGTALATDDANPCTADSCDPTTGVAHTPVAAGTSCADSNGCNGAETCNASGTCQAGTPVATDDSNPCTADSCDPATGGVAHTPVAVGTTCASGTGSGPEICNASASCVAFDPAIVAPPLDRTVSPTLYEMVSFLFEGPNAIQVGVAPGTFEPQRIGVVRGRVADLTGAPIAQVSIDILGHPELGHTITRADGSFDLVVNGGAILNVRYSKTGYLTVQRAVDTPWRDYVWAPDVVMVQLDSQVTAVDLSAATIQVARGTAVADADGSRQATVLFRAGTTATMRLADGSTSPLPVIHFRATEYTVGEKGPAAMPASLPPQSGYTYAVELSADEAISADAVAVEFSQPVVSYTENFLHFPVGTVVPVGSFDRASGVWVPSQNGRVIKVVSITSGAADLDVTGSGTPSSPVALSALGITDDERQTLAASYAPGQTLWRVSIPHFSSWDYNWSFGYALDAIANLFGPLFGRDIDSSDNPCEDPGSIIECENLTLRENLGLTGTPHALSYSSARVIGREDRRSIKIPLTFGTLPATLTGSIELEVSVAGQRFSQSFAPAPNLSYTYTWDGKDAFGRLAQGSQLATITVTHWYVPTYWANESDNLQAFNRFPRETGLGIEVQVSPPSNRRISSVQTTRVRLGGWDPTPEGLGGWQVSSHHVYDPNAKRLYLGDGTSRDQDVVGSEPRDVAGLASGTPPPPGPVSAPASSVYLAWPQGMSAAPDGSIFFADKDANRIYKLTRDRQIVGVAGTGGFFAFHGDGGPAIEASVDHPQSVAVAQDGSGCFYIADTGNNRIRKVDASGIITTIAGNGQSAPPGLGHDHYDGMVATSVPINGPFDVGVFGGDVYFIHFETSNGDNMVLRRVSTSGGPISTIYLPSNTIRGLTITHGGQMYLADGNPGWIWGPGFQAGIVNGIPQGLLLGEDIHAQVKDHLKANPLDLDMGPDGRLYLPEVYLPLTGKGQVSIFQGLSQLAIGLEQPRGIAVDRDGRVYVSETGKHRILGIEPSYPGVVAGNGPLLIASQDGATVYRFDHRGRHLDTRDATTGVALLSFGYDTNGQLTTITDRSGNITSINRASNGVATSVAGPYGETSTLSYDAAGHLASLTDAANETVHLTHSSTGLLTKLTDPRGHEHLFTYQPDGRLFRDADPDGGSTTLAATQTPGGGSVAVTSAMGRSKQHTVELGVDGTLTRTLTATDGTVTRTQLSIAGQGVATLPNGMIVTTTYTADPVFGMAAPLPGKVVTRTPGGLSQTATLTRVVSLADPSNPLSVLSSTDTAVIGGQPYTTDYDFATHTITDRTPLGRVAHSVLNTEGQVVHSDAPGTLPIDISYDSFGRPHTVVQGSRMSTVTYGADGRAHITTNSSSISTTVDRDAVGRPVRSVSAEDQDIAFGYDVNGNLTSLTPPARSAYTFAYTAADFGSDSFAPDLGAGAAVTHTTFNADHQPSDILRPDGTHVTLAYDGAGRLQHVTSADGQSTYTYDSATGALTSLVGADGNSVTLTYDGALLKDQTVAGTVAGSIHRTYDNSFRVASVSVNGGSGIPYTYDDDSVIASAGDLTLAHDASTGALTSSSVGVVTDSLAYSPYREPATYAASVSGTTVFATQYTRDSLGRIIRSVESSAGVSTTYDYVYDDIGRLRRMDVNGTASFQYTYDPNGNLTSRTSTSGTTTYATDGRDRLVSAGSETFTSGPNGEIAARSGFAGVTTYSYNAFGALVGTHLPDGRQISYVLDPSRRRIAKQVGATQVQAFLYGAGNSPLAELDAAGAVRSVFVYGTGRVTPDYFIQGTNKYRIVTDHRGSPRLVVDVATGQVVQRMAFDPYGRVVQDTNPGFQPFGFAGGLLDRDTGLEHYGAREYDPDLGRWTSADPLGFGGGDTNLYAYSGNDPVNALDPSGLWLESFVNFAAGVGDVLSFGVGSTLRERMGINSVAPCSEAYTSASSLTSDALDFVSWGTLGASVPEVPSEEPPSGAGGSEGVGTPGEGVLKHYTDEEGFNGINETGTIKAGRSGRVYVTTDAVSPADANASLFAGDPSYAGKGTHVIEFIPNDGVVFQAGTQDNELVHWGSLRFGRHIRVTFRGRNPY